MMVPPDISGNVEGVVLFGMAPSCYFCFGTTNGTRSDAEYS